MVAHWEWRRVGLKGRRTVDRLVVRWGWSWVEKRVEKWVKYWAVRMEN